ncbi:MAG: NADH-quinone oxidoreductase subunit J [Parachlamydiaceae bacterium]
MNLEIFFQILIGAILILSSIGVLIAKKPVYASLSFLLTLISLAALYLQLSAEFIAVMQVLVYAGAILVIFMFVIILFQDAYLKIEQSEPSASMGLISLAITALVAGFSYLGYLIWKNPVNPGSLPDSFGTVQELGKALYLDFFFPFEAIILLFLVAMIGTVYIGKREI